jgi:hypothetical protein
MSSFRPSHAAAFALAATLLTLALSGCGGSDSKSPTAPGTPADSVATARTQTYQRINELRATLSLPPLSQWTDGEACAAAQAKTDYEAGTPHSAFGSCGESGQNEAVGWSLASQIPTDALQAMWDEGPGDFSTHGHYLNLSSTAYHKVAVGIYVTPAKSVWAVMNFAP